MSIDLATLTRLFVREHDRLAAYAWSLVHDDHLVDDILQEVALIATRKCDEIVDEHHFLGWMRVTCRNVALDMSKRRNRSPSLLGDEALNLLDVEWARRDQAATSDLTDALRTCLERLSPYARQLVGLRYGQGLKSARIAALLQRDTNAVYVALTRVHRKLGDCVRLRLSNEAAHG
jgi:RNA polymerase sigma-70 factor (ECF subfamily)